MSISNELKTGINTYRNDIKEIINFLFQFVRNPVDRIKRVPNWPWPQLIACYITIASATGFVSGLILFKVSQILFGLILFPIAAFLAGIMLSAFLYYFFLYIFNRPTNFKDICTIVTLSLVPYFALYTISHLMPLLKLVGFAVTGLLLIVGLTENTGIPRIRIIKLIAGLYLTYMVLVIVNMIKWERENKQLKDEVTQDSIELLKKEFNQ